MNPHFNDTDFQVQHARYDRMLTSAQRNIALQKGEDGIPVRRGFFVGVAALAIRLSNAMRRPAPAVPTAVPFPVRPCPDESPC